MAIFKLTSKVTKDVIRRALADPVPSDIPESLTTTLDKTLADLVMENHGQMLSMWSPEEYEAQLQLADEIEADIIKLLEARDCTYVLALAIFLKMAVSAQALLTEAEDEEKEAEA